MDKAKKILLVEDNLVMATLEKKRLEKKGYSVVHVSTGEKAIALLQKEHASLVLMDIDLGMGMDGTQTAERILSFTEIPIVFLSSHTEPEVVEKTEKITSYGYVVKNSGITVLDASIKMAFKLFDAKQSIISHKNDLLENKRILTESQEMAKMGSWSLDVASLIMTLSPEHQFMAEGIRAEISMPLTEYSDRYIIKDDREKIATHLGSAIREIHNLDYSDEFEYRLVDPAKKEIRYMLVRGKTQKNGIIYGITHDITDRKKNENALIQELDNMGKILSAMKIGLILQDREFRVHWVNPSIREMFPEGNPIGKKCYEFFVGRDQPCEKCAVEKAFHTKQTATVISHNQENNRWYSFVAQPILEKDGEIRQVLETVMDITDQKNLEQELLRKEERLRVTLNSIEDAVISTDTVGLVTGMNPKAETLTGYTEKDALGKPIGQVFRISSSITGEPVEDPVRIVLDSGAVAGLANHTQLVSRQGGLYQITDSAAPIRGPEGNIMGVVMVFRDITVEYAIREKIARDEERYRKIYYNAPMSIFDYDHNGIIRECNDSFIALIGSSREDLIGLHMLRDLKDEKIKDAVRATLSGKNASYQDWYSSVTASKNTFIHVLFHPVYDSLGEIVGGVAMADDITPMKNLEMKLAKSLEENKELLRELQHRAKNSFAMIVGMMDLAVLGAESPETVHLLTDIASRVRAISELYEILYSSQSVRSISLKDYLARIGRSLIPESASVELQLNLEEVILSSKKAIRIGIITAEVITNALKHAFSAGQSGKITLDLQKSSDGFRLEICDNGRGIPEDFDYRKSESLGLQLAMDLASQTDGSFSIKPRKPSGVSCVLELR